MSDEQALKDSPDATFRFCMSEDGMKLGVNRYFPPNGGKEPSVPLLRAQVAACGVRLPVDEDAARRIVEAVTEGREFRGITLVRGIPPREPREASLAPLGDLEYPVFPDDRFLRFRPATKAAEGETIDGRTLKPNGTFTPKPVKVERGENADWDPAAEAYYSLVWGMVRVRDNVVSVDPVAHITHDEVEIVGTIFHKDFRGEPITPERIEKQLRDMGVLIPVDLEALLIKLRQAAAANMPLPNQVLVQGAHPVPGRDGWLESLVATREETGTEDASGRLDFRDRGFYPMVVTGQIIGRLHPPTAGEGGIDIYGKTIPAHAGRELKIHLGENVLLQNDGVTYAAKAQGVAVMERNTLSVTQCLVVQGNVDLNSGNVKVEHGSIKVLGSIQAGFSVSAPRHVLVDGSIESATVYAGGLVEVKGGILMPDGGEIVSDGRVIANYAINARIRARHDVIIANEVQNSTIRTDGRITALSGKGTVLGGEILARRGIEVNELGSELGVATVVGILLDEAEDEDLREERLRVVRSIKKIDATLGTEPPETLLARTPEARRAALAEVIKHREALVRRRDVLSEKINGLTQRRQQEMEGITIRVKKFVHPGTVIQFGTIRKKVEKRLPSPVFYWDPEKRDILCR
ncbi:protein of unknown function DUF342 [Pseudodesulfovibrio mercurii]|uniref:Flagellar Assembly Protein A N-terminal region domain-containing protein n=1 Tax=Pseudodesulfovibrio mercurii TaxID=641491 RepID=F0JHE1_9BACT|nr:FapA family protein [Pseudodesulfovibrio mercurii]EGB15256.1 protein of unknown function DUF342 [Pseudodesulfovibrio mercurii]